MSGFYDASPALVDDIPKAEEVPPQAATRGQDAAQPAEPAAADPKPTESADTGPVENAANDRSPFAADVMPLGSEVQTTLRSMAVESGEDAETADALAGAWKRNFEFYGIGGAHVPHILEAWREVSRQAPGPEVAQRWQAEAKERLASDFGNPEAATRALTAAQQWVAKHPELRSFLHRTGLGNHPRVVAAIAQTAHMARQGGKKF